MVKVVRVVEVVAGRRCSRRSGGCSGDVGPRGRQRMQSWYCQRRVEVAVAVGVVARIAGLHMDILSMAIDRSNHGYDGMHFSNWASIAVVGGGRDRSGAGCVVISVEVCGIEGRPLILSVYHPTVLGVSQSSHVTET